MRRTLDGSKIARGRKKRRNIRKQVARNPVMLAQTIRRRTLLIGGSGMLSTTEPVRFMIARGAWVAARSEVSFTTSCISRSTGGSTERSLDSVDARTISVIEFGSFMALTISLGVEAVLAISSAPCAVATSTCPPNNRAFWRSLHVHILQHREA